MATTQRSADPALTAPTYARGAALLKLGVIGGLLAGAVFAIFEMIMSAAMGMGALAPWGMFASIILGQRALEGMTVGIFLVGFIVHFGISAIFGLVWGAISRAVPLGIRASYGAHGGAAALFGVGLYLVNFHLVARVLYPWFLGANQFGQLLLHALAFGLPLGLFMVWQLTNPALLGRNVGRKQTV